MATPKKTSSASSRKSLDPLVIEALDRGLIAVDDSFSRITYKAAQQKDYSLLDPEEPVRAFLFALLCVERGYDPKRIRLEVPIKIGTATKFADIVLFLDDACRKPFLVFESVSPEPSGREREEKIKQAFSYAKQIDALYVGYASGTDDSDLWVVQTQWGIAERTRNRIGDAFALRRDYAPNVTFTLERGGSNDLRTVSPGELESAVRAAHATIWSGGKRDPLEAFDEWSKLLFAKIYDEFWTADGQAYTFQVGLGEPDSEVAKRVKDLFHKARLRDTSVFSDDLQLPDDKIRAVVETTQHIAMTDLELDNLGQAFEQFFGSVFRGDLGQYFTRRELCRFVVAALEVKPDDRVVDPTAGSGGFLLETLIQVVAWVNSNLKSRKESERQRAIDHFAQQRLFGVEINQKLGRVCQTNLILHRDGHVNVVPDHTVLDSSFPNPNLKFGTFTVAVGNPPFGDKVEDGSVDQLGQNSLTNFELGNLGIAKVPSEFLVMEQTVKLLAPGGRFGMVIPDGMLNNGGERSLCPDFRYFLLRHGRLDAIVSLPDHAFRKSGAQNKTSILLFTKYSEKDQAAFDSEYATQRAKATATTRIALERETLRAIYSNKKFDYPVFVAEAEHIGYSPSGQPDERNDLYSGDVHAVDAKPGTILHELKNFRRKPNQYKTHSHPPCASVHVSEMFSAHPTVRMDPKFHVFRALENIAHPPSGMTEYQLGAVLSQRSNNLIQPNNFPDRQFDVLTLRQTGVFSPREPGIGRNPVAWYGRYFAEGSIWCEARAGDLVFSRIDLWKGCVSILPTQHDRAIFTKEFPIYEVNRSRLDPTFLKLLLRSRYFQRAIRSVTTGHSNRRRTQPSDFEELRVFLPPLEIQKEIGKKVRLLEKGVVDDETRLRFVLRQLDEAVVGEIDLGSFIKHVDRMADHEHSLTAKEREEADLALIADVDPLLDGEDA